MVGSHWFSWFPKVILRCEYLGVEINTNILPVFQATNTTRYTENGDEIHR